MNRLYIQKTVLLFVLMLLLNTYSVFATPSVTWNNNSGDNKWSNASNWSSGSVPVSGAISIPDMSGATIYLDTTISISTLTMSGNAVLSINSGKTLTLSSTLTLNTSSFVKSAININSGNLVSNSGITGSGIIHAGSGILTIKTTVANTITVDPGTSTIIISGTGAQAGIYISNYYNLQIDNTTAGGLTLNNNIKVSGNLMGSGRLKPQANIVTIYGNMSVSSLTSGTSTFILAGSTTQSINGYAFYNLKNDNSAGTTLLGNASISNQLTFDPSGGPGAYSNPSYLYVGNKLVSIGSTASIVGASETNGFIVMNGTTGTVKAYSSPTGFTIPFGPSTTKYAPITVYADASLQFIANVTNAVNKQTMEAATTHAVNATWMVIPNGSNITGFSAAMQWKASQLELPSFDRSNIYFYYKHNEVLDSAWRQLGSLTSASGSDPYTAQTESMTLTTTTYFSIADKNTALPVELTSFDAHSDNGKNILEWNTASEINNDHFEIQRFDDSKKWNTIGEVAGHGTTNEKQFYSFTDGSVQTSGDVYYRLKQVDYNGAFKYSEIRRINIEKQNITTKIFPNPAREIINVSFINDGVSRNVKIFDMQGICVYSTSCNSFQKQIDISSLSNGMYILRTYSGNDVNAKVFCKE